ncbi:hypothetical protein BpHYR1_049275 [Brachionus plicatilis]|uniref:Transmembrane protein n=1 Tax=Brachionus plicatilis TaxID=10195 RepID=A0A3M7RZV4_BRAPC|nr:hypothetical protein BpHYR1_049275 [Brachionus plicatilis]
MQPNNQQSCVVTKLLFFMTKQNLSDAFMTDSNNVYLILYLISSLISVISLTKILLPLDILYHKRKFLTINQNFLSIYPDLFRALGMQIFSSNQEFFSFFKIKQTKIINSLTKGELCI